MTTPQAQPATAKRRVVSSFIIKDYPENPKVAMFRRSGKVRTYPHHLGAISGSVDKEDATPLATAWREMQEETTLTSQSVALLREGKPFVFSDQSVGREWTIYPFAFRLKTTAEGGSGEAGIKIDWEHESWAWYDPKEVEDVPSFEGVPRIAESLRRVWFEKEIGDSAGKVLALGLEKLRAANDGELDAAANLALEVLRDTASNLVAPGGSWDEWWRWARLAAWHICTNGNKNIAPTILGTMHSALTSIESKVSDNGLSVAEKIDIATKDLASKVGSGSAQDSEDLDVENELLFQDL